MLNSDEQKLRAIRAWAKTRKRVAVELCEREALKDPSEIARYRPHCEAYEERLRADRARFFAEHAAAAAPVAAPVTPAPRVVPGRSVTCLRARARGTDEEGNDVQARRWR